MLKTVIHPNLVEMLCGFEILRFILMKRYIRPCKLRLRFLRHRKRINSGSATVRSTQQHRNWSTTDVEDSFGPHVQICRQSHESRISLLFRNFIIPVWLCFDAPPITFILLRQFPDAGQHRRRVRTDLKLLGSSKRMPLAQPVHLPAVWM